MTELSIQDVERLIKQLENPIRSAKTKAATQLASANIFPSLISNSSQFIHDVVTPVLNHVSDNTEAVRENCIKAIEKYVDELYKEAIKEVPSDLSEIFFLILPTLFSRLKTEKVENSEHLRLYLLKLLLKFVKMITDSTMPNNLDSFIDDMIDPLTLSFKSKEAEMKKIGCDFLNEILLRCSKINLSILSENLSHSVFSNCFHHHYEVRKKSLHTLGLLYVSSGTFTNENTESLNNSLQKLSEDRNSNVRKEVIFFCSIILTQHEEKNNYYFPLLIPILYFLYPIIPVYQTEIGTVSPVQQKKITDESILSLKSLNDIGSLYSGEWDDADNITFDESNGYVANGGVVHLICDFSERLLQVLLSLIIDWTESRRNYGFSALTSFLQLCGSYAERYSPHIMQTLIKSLHDNQDDFNKSLQCQSIISSSLQFKDIVSFLVPRITSDGPKEIIHLLTVSIINSNFNEEDETDEEQLNQILNRCLAVRIYTEADLIEPLVQLTLALIKQSYSFANENSLHLSILILKMSEKTDALKCFLNAFEKPISLVFSENLPELMVCDEKTPLFYKVLLENCQKEAIMANQDLISDELSSFLKSKAADKIIIKEIVNKLKQKNCLTQFSFND